MTRKLKSKLTAVLLLALLAPNLVWAVDYTADANCQGAWLFTEGSGITVADDSQNSNTGNFVSSGHPAWAAMSGTNAPTYADYMADFTPNDYIGCGVTNLPSPRSGDDVSLTTWVDRDATGTEHKLLARWDDNSAGSGKYSFLLGVTSGNLAQIAISKADKNGIYVKAGTSTITSGSWWFICGTWNKTSVEIFVNGVSEGTSSTGGGSDSGSDSAECTLGCGANLPLQRNGFLDGKMFESSVFDRVLDSTEINDIMDNGLAGAAPPAGFPQIIINIL